MLLFVLKIFIQGFGNVLKLTFRSLRIPWAPWAPLAPVARLRLDQLSLRVSGFFWNVEA